MATSEQTLDEQKLPDIFKEIWKLYDVLEQTEESTSSDKNQNHVRRACQLCKTAIDMVNKLELFSDNEEIEEVATNEIKYMLLPALMGYFLMKNSIRERLRVVKECQDFYTDYIRLCKVYNVTDVPMPERPEPELEQATAEARPGPPRQSGMRDVQSMAYTRGNKIQRYKEQKALEKKIHDLRDQVERDHVDDEVKRDYYLSMVTRWVNVAVEDLDSIKSEIGILEKMAQRKEIMDREKGKMPKHPVPQKPPPLRPFIITKDMLQKQVYGLGYPGIPTMTIEEFVDKKVEEGHLQLPGTGSHSMQDWAMDPDKDKEDQEREQGEKEIQEEKDDEEQRRKAQEWDEYKDDHRRGWGNRQNRA